MSDSFSGVWKTDERTGDLHKLDKHGNRTGQVIRDRPTTESPCFTNLDFVGPRADAQLEEIRAMLKRALKEVKP